MSNAKNPPVYRRKICRGKEVAVVTLSDCESKARRDIYLGSYGSPESRQYYARLLADWEARGRRLPDQVSIRRCLGGPTISQIAAAYLDEVQRSAARRRLDCACHALRVLRDHYGETPAADFGPRSLRLLQSAMLMGSADRKAWSPRTVNERVALILDMFRWAVAEEALQPAVHQALLTIKPVKGIHRRKVMPVDQAAVDAVKPFVSEQVWAVIQLQLTTGARPSELLELRPSAVDRTEAVWRIVVEKHKTAGKGKARTLYVGPQAQAILAPYLLRPAEAYCFSPSESEQKRREHKHAARKTPLSCGNKPGSNRSDDPLNQPGDRYTRDSYRQAIWRACDKAWPLPDELVELVRRGDETPEEWRARVSREDWAAVIAWRRTHRWNPYQLRHNYATNVRKHYGLEAAQILLGHCSARVTDAVYAERDQGKAVAIAAAIG
jgi:integrase